MKKVLIALSTFGKYKPDPLDEFRTRGYEVVFNPYGRKLKEEEVIKHSQNCDGILAGLEPLNEKVLNALPQLKVISRSGIGVDNIDLKVAAEKNIKVLTTPDAPTNSVVEITIGLILDVLRKVSHADRLIRQKKWTRLKGVQLAGKKVGIVGLGRIGRGVAEVLKSLKADVLGYDPMPNLDWVKGNGVTLLPLNDLLAESDLVTLHVPKPKDGTYLIGEKEFSTMKPHSFIFNLSRGGVVDEKALVQNLKSGHLAGAGIDVFENEPYTGPLLEFDNVVLTAHMGSHTAEARVKMEKEAAQNLLEGLVSQQ